jgi:hypothetical protein
MFVLAFGFKSLSHSKKPSVASRTGSLESDAHTLRYLFRDAVLKFFRITTSEITCRAHPCARFREPHPYLREKFRT